MVFGRVGYTGVKRKFRRLFHQKVGPVSGFLRAAPSYWRSRRCRRGGSTGISEGWTIMPLFGLVMGFWQGKTGRNPMAPLRARLSRLSSPHVESRRGRSHLLDGLPRDARLPGDRQACRPPVPRRGRDGPPLRDSGPSRPSRSSSWDSFSHSRSRAPPHGSTCAGPRSSRRRTPSGPHGSASTSFHRPLSRSCATGFAGT